MCYGTDFLADTLVDTLPSIVIPDHLGDIVEDEEDAEVLPILLRWAPFLKDNFNGKQFYQVIIK